MDLSNIYYLFLFICKYKLKKFFTERKHSISLFPQIINLLKYLWFIRCMLLISLFVYSTVAELRIVYQEKYIESIFSDKQYFSKN